MSRGLRKVLQRARVAAGYVFAVVFLVFCRPTPVSIAAGSVAIVAGLAFRAWACGHLRKGRELDTSGPYAYTRNPLYLGSFFIVAGFAIASNVWWLAGAAIIVFLSIYLPVIGVETTELEHVMGDEYREYAAGVPKIVPRLSRWVSPKTASRSFDFQLYLKNGEYMAAIGVGAGILVLILMSYYQGSL